MDYYAVQHNVFPGVSETRSFSLFIFKVIKCGSVGFKLSNLTGMTGTKAEGITFLRNVSSRLPICTT